jgi:LuxR family maltose regulon positive regulatory protein
LQHQLGLKLDGEEIAALHRRASCWYAENGFIDEALHHALKAGDLPMATELVEQNGPALWDEDNWRTLERWLAQLPDDIIQQRPKLLLARAWVLFYSLALWAVPPILEEIEAVLGDDEATQPLWGEVDLHWGKHWYWLGQASRSLESLNRALERIPKALHKASGEAELFWGLASQMVGHKNETIRRLNKWLYYEQSPHPVRQLRLEAALLFIHLLSGELAEAAPVIE